MRKKILSGLLSLMILTVTGCAQQNQDVEKQEQPELAARQTIVNQEMQDAVPEETEIQETETQETETEQEKSNGQNILIAYFTWADNTHVENPEDVDVDATTSASVLPPGNAARLADWIQEEVGGDVFSIQVEEPYSSDYDECLDRAADEKAENARPVLSSHVENMSQYDVIFLGFPNWWYTLPMPIYSFIEEYDLEGKTVIPFCTHGTGGLASTIDDLENALPESVSLLEPIGVYRQDVDSAQPKIQEWIRKFGFLA